MEHNRFKPRVLVLDDDRTSLYVLNRLLEAAGIEVIECTEPQEAFRWLERDLPDLILLDIVMPGMNGYEVCQMLKSGTRTRDIPLIFLTAKTDSQDIVKGLEAGAVDYVKKPFESRELLARVHTHVELKCNRDRVLHLLEEQRIDIGVAKQVLRLVDGPPVKRVLLPGGAQLFAEVLLQPCREQGGDHAFFMSLPPTPAYPAGRTVISLKDQSGHDVGCVIRSIFSDLVHCGLMFTHSDQSLASLMTAVNREICQAGLGRPDHFFTALTLELDHADLTLRGISMGHPPLILIRNGAARLFPEPAGPGWSLPVGVDGLVELTVQETRLEPGDKLVLYTDGLIE
ncbi:MAG TPA: fused response regulator/phosphatase, partial [Candidatus Sumerlaeota bacterium]|nr:fused response regulator/phosphatase [Candidatus Sumerlaeota bacterium]